MSVVHLFADGSCNYSMPGITEDQSMSAKQTKSRYFCHPQNVDCSSHFSATMLKNANILNDIYLFFVVFFFWLIKLVILPIQIIFIL